MLNKRLTELEERLEVCLDGIKAADTLIQSWQFASKDFIEELLRDKKLLLENKEKIIAEIRKIRDNVPMLTLTDYIDQKLAES